jgi:hypothetical protein
MEIKNAIAEFWQLFELNAAQLAKARSADSVVYDELLEELHEIDEGLFIEFATSPDECELVITAEGKKALFPLVEQIVAAAPAAKGWKIFALKPKLGFPEFIQWEGYQLSLDDVVFDPLESNSDELGLRLLVPGLGDEDSDSAHDALLRAIDHGLGEREFAEAVGYTEVAALEGSADEFISLTDLESFIEWRKKQCTG